MISTCGIAVCNKVVRQTMLGTGCLAVDFYNILVLYRKVVTSQQSQMKRPSQTELEINTLKEINHRLVASVAA